MKELGGPAFGLTRRRASKLERPLEARPLHAQEARPARHIGPHRPTQPRRRRERRSECPLRHMDCQTGKGRAGHPQSASLSSRPSSRVTMRVMTATSTLSESRASAFAMRDYTLRPPHRADLGRRGRDAGLPGGRRRIVVARAAARRAEGEPNHAQLLVEFSGRACYRSWEPGLNPNVRRIRTDQREYLLNLLSSLHGSVLEHASYTLPSTTCRGSHPRACAASGGVGLQPGEPALRQADGARRPGAGGARARSRAGGQSRRATRGVSGHQAERLGLDDDDFPFSVKKEVTSRCAASRRSA